MDSHHIDILLADLDLPDGPGNQSIKALSTKSDKAITIVISSSMDSAVILQAIADGAVNYIHKGDDSSEIITIIETALAGDSPISPSIANKIVTPLHNKGNDSLLAGIFPNKAGRKPQYHAEPKQKAQILSPRELEVLNLISFAIYRDLFPIFTWYIVPPRTIESTTVGKSSIREDACQYPFAEINW